MDAGSRHYAKAIVLALIVSNPAARAAVQSPECKPDCPCNIPILFDSEALANGTSQTHLQRQYDALRAMRLEWIEYLPQGPVSFLVGETGYQLPPEVTKWRTDDNADAILKILNDVLLANGTENLKVREIREQGGSVLGIMMMEHIRGIPVVDGVVSIKYDTRTMRVSMVASHFVPDRNLPREPILSALDAEKRVSGETTDPTYLGYYLKCCGSAPARLVWVVRVWSNDSWMHYIDAITGGEVDRRRMSSN
jgi:hypothetical protein